MNRQTTRISTLTLISAVAFSLFVVGCSSSPSTEELRQLSTLKDEVSALQREVASKEQAKSALEREVAEKNAKLKKCNDDQQIVKQRLGQ